MIDYEFKIRQLEKDLEHYREIQQLHREHLDAHDKTIDGLREITQQTTKNLDQLTIQVAMLGVKVDALTSNVDKLVNALLREHPNGKGQGEGDA